MSSGHSVQTLFNKLIMQSIMLMLAASSQAAPPSGQNMPRSTLELDFSTYLGGSGDEYGYGIACTGDDRYAITGYTTSTDLPMIDPFQGCHGGGEYDAFVAWFCADSLRMSTFVGGTGDDYARGIAADDSGNVYVTGWTDSENFPVCNAIQPQLAGGDDCFILKFSPGGELLYSTYLGGTGSETARSIAVDCTGSVYLTGYTNSTDFPLAAPYQDLFAGSYDAFIVKLSPDGTQMVYSTYYGGSQLDVGRGIAVDSQGSVTILGETTSLDLPLEQPLQSSYGGGDRDMFMARLDSNGDSLIFGTYLGGNGTEYGLSIVTDETGCCYFAGLTGSTDYPVVSPVQGTLGGGEDAAVGKISSQGDQLIYSTYLGGSADDRAIGVCVDSSGCAYVTGATLSSDFPVLNPYQSSNSGGFDTIVAKLSEIGQLEFSTYLGGYSHDYCIGIMLDSRGSATVSGRTKSQDYPLANPVQSQNAGGWDGFVSRLVQEGTGMIPHPQSYFPSLRLYSWPEPFSGTLTFRFRGISAGVHHLRVLDVSGRTVAEFTRVASEGETETIQWCPAELPAGIYFAELTDPEGGRASGKILHLSN